MSQTLPAVTIEEFRPASVLRRPVLRLLMIRAAHSTVWFLTPRKVRVFLDELAAVRCGGGDVGYETRGLRKPLERREGAVPQERHPRWPVP